MNTIKETTSKLLNKLDVGKLIETYEAKTVKGTEIRNTIINNFESLSNSVSGLMYIRERFNLYAPVDNGLYSIVEKIDEALVEDSFKFKAIYCYEQLKDSKDTIKSKASKSLEELLDKSVDEAKTDIRNGKFNGYLSSIPILSLLTEESKIKTQDNEEDEIFEVSTPYSYVEESNSGLNIRLGNKVFAIVGEKLVETVSPSPKFNYVSSVVENLVKYDPTNLVFVYEDETQRIEVCNHKIKRILGENVSEYTSSSEFANNMKLVVESAKNKGQLSEIVDALIALKENYSNISKADNFRLIKNKRTNETFAMGKIKGNHIILTLNSNRLPKLVENHSSAIDAINSLRKKSGYDSSLFFQDTLIRESKEITELNTEYIERKDIVDEIEKKIAEIDKHIIEARYDGNVEREKSLIKNKSIAESLLIEQKTELKNLLNK